MAPNKRIGHRTGFRDDYHWDWKQPEKKIPNLVWSDGTHGSKLTKEEVDLLKRNPRGKKNAKWDELEEVPLCDNCGWNAYMQAGSYLSKVQMYYTIGGRGMWALGDDWLLWDRPLIKNGGNDYITWKFLHDQGVKNIPLLADMKQLSGPDDETQLTLMSRAKGEVLYDVWIKASMEEKEGYVQQIADVLIELRKFTSPYPCKVDGTPTNDIVFQDIECWRHGCHTTQKTPEEWIEGYDEDIRVGLTHMHEVYDDPDFIEEKVKEVKANFKDPGPYVLTHGDLHFQNIFAENGKITAIIDWENAAYLPWWIEPQFQNLNDEIVDAIWEKVDQRLASEEKRLGISEPFYKATEAISDATHIHEDCYLNSGWLRPNFCECKPHGGFVATTFVGQRYNHKGHRLIKAPRRNSEEAYKEKTEILDIQRVETGRIEKARLKKFRKKKKEERERKEREKKEEKEREKKEEKDIQERSHTQAPES